MVKEQLYANAIIAVNSELFLRVSFPENFTNAKFYEKLTLANGKVTLPFIDVGKSCFSPEFLTHRSR